MEGKGKPGDYNDDIYDNDDNTRYSGCDNFLGWEAPTMSYAWRLRVLSEWADILSGALNPTLELPPACRWHFAIGPSCPRTSFRSPPRWLVIERLKQTIESEPEALYKVDAFGMNPLHILALMEKLKQKGLEAR